MLNSKNMERLYKLGLHLKFHSGGLPKSSCIQLVFSPFSIFVISCSGCKYTGQLAPETFFGVEGVFELHNARPKTIISPTFTITEFLLISFVLSEIKPIDMHW